MSPVVLWPSFLHSLTPDQAISTGTIGLLLIFFELNRPGKIIAGCSGLLLFLFAVAAMRDWLLRPGFCLLLALSLGAFLFNLYQRLPAWVLAGATLGLIAALRGLVQAPAPASTGLSAPSTASFAAQSVVHWPCAVLCGGLLGTASAVLTRIAHRARRAKALN